MIEILFSLYRSNLFIIGLLKPSSGPKVIFYCIYGSMILLSMIQMAVVNGFILKGMVEKMVTRYRQLNEVMNNSDRVHPSECKTNMSIRLLENRRNDGSSDAFTDEPSYQRNIDFCVLKDGSCQN